LKFFLLLIIKCLEIGIYFFDVLLAFANYLKEENMKKRVLSLGIVLTMMASSMQTFAEDYLDMPTGWSNAAMTYAVNNGYIKGSNGKLNPQGLATRAQVASIFARVLKLENKADLGSYTDVNASQWYYDDLAKAVDAGLFKGSDNKLRPNDNITREEVMAIIARAYDLSGENGNLSAFIDGSTVSSWAVNAVSALVENGIVNGSNGKLNPKTNITREEFAQLLYNCENKFGADEESTEITTDAEDTSVDTTKESSTETTTFVGKNSIKAAGGGSSSSSSKKSNTKTTEATTETTTEETTKTTTAVALESQNKVTVDGTDYYVATLEKPMSDYTFTFNGTVVTPTAVNAEKTIVKYSDTTLSGYKFAKKTLTYGEYWYAETSDGFNGTLSTEFAKNGTVAEIPDSYTTTQSADDKYAATGADTDAGMYDAVSRATTGYGLGRLSFTQAVNALNSNGEMAPFSSSIKYENGAYTVVRPDNAKADFGYDGSSNRGSNGKITATGIKDVVVSVSKDMAVNAEILKNVSGYEAQAQKVSDEIASLNFDADLNENNVYAYKELNANGLYGKRVVNDNVSVKNVGNYSEANTNDDNKFTVNTKYAKRFGDVTFLVYFDDYANMKADDPAHKNINTDEAVAGKVGEFKDYIYNVQGAKIEYLGEDGTATPVVAGAKFASDLWISPNHGPVVEVAVTNSYDRFKAFGNGKYRITLVADGYKDVVLESSARFDLDSPLKMQGDDDDVSEITNGTDLVLNYDINNATYAESLVNAVANGTANITIGEGRNTVAENGKVVVNGNVLTLTFENVKDSLKKDTQYTVTFPTLDYNDADKLGMTASVHYAPADAVSTTAEENNEEKAVVTETEDNTTVFEDVVKDSTSDITDVIAVALPEVDETKAVVVNETTVAETEETTEEVTEETTEEATAETIVEEVTESETVAE
jgi:hypothetical protein